MSAWAAAFLVTQLVEAPIVFRFARGAWWRRLGIALGGSTVTHPVLWAVFSFLVVPTWPAIAVAEVIVTLAEAGWMRLCGVPRPLAVAVLANASSLVAGEVLRAVVGWP